MVLSKKGGILKTLQIPTKFNIAAPIGNGNQYQSWIHEYDLSNMIMESIFNKWYGFIMQLAQIQSNKKFYKTLR